MAGGRPGNDLECHPAGAIGWICVVVLLGHRQGMERVIAGLLGAFMAGECWRDGL